MSRKKTMSHNFEVMYQTYGTFVGDGRDKDIWTFYDLLNISRNRLNGLRSGLETTRINVANIQKELRSVAPNIEFDARIFTGKLKLEAPSFQLENICEHYQTAKPYIKEKMGDLDKFINSLESCKLKNEGQEQFLLWCKFLRTAKRYYKTKQVDVNIKVVLEALKTISTNSLTNIDYKQLSVLEDTMIHRLNIVHNVIRNHRI